MFLAPDRGWRKDGLSGNHHLPDGKGKERTQRHSVSIQTIVWRRKRCILDRTTRSNRRKKYTLVKVTADIKVLCITKRNRFGRNINPSPLGFKLLFSIEDRRHTAPNSLSGVQSRAPATILKVFFIYISRFLHGLTFPGTYTTLSTPVTATATKAL